MILNYETIINKIVETAKISKEDVELKVKNKLNELQGLITKEGAAHIIANSLDIKLFDSSPKTLKINNLQAGLSNINITARIMNIYEIRSFTKNDKNRKVANILIGDETGTTRVVIWDENIINLISTMNEGDILKIINAQSKENNGNIELHLGNKSEVKINPEGEAIGEIKITIKSNKKQIKDLKENESVELYGTVVQIFEPRFYNACPICRKKVLEQNSIFSCAEHNEITPNKVPIVNIILDDGTGNIRAVLFRDLAEKLTNKNEEYEKIRKECLGRQLILKGKVNKNEMFNKLEIMTNFVEEANPETILNQN